MPMINFITVGVAAHEHRSMFQVSVDRLKLILKTVLTDSFVDDYYHRLVGTGGFEGGLLWATEADCGPYRRLSVGRRRHQQSRRVPSEP